LVQRYINLKLPLKHVLKIILAASFMFCCVRFGMGKIHLVFVVIGGAFIYAGSIFLLNVFNRKDYAIVVTLIRRLRMLQTGEPESRHFQGGPE